ANYVFFGSITGNTIVATGLTIDTNYDFYVQSCAGTQTAGPIPFTIPLSLPTELSSFTGEALAKINRLEWVSSMEENTEVHEVERSADGLAWQSIGSVAAAGNSVEAITYDFHDESPLGSALYRVRTVDLDGSFSLSPLVEIVREDASNRLQLGKIYPQPTTGPLTIPIISAEGQERLSLRLLDGTGKQVRQRISEVSTGRNQITFDLAGLPPGLYWLQVTDKRGSMITKKVVMQ
ncbi:MAG: T9SS type A sorting domain-containing protein, partial [Bacteroidota bacterium]